MPLVHDVYMPKYRVIVDYTSKRTAEIEADSADEAALQAMRELKVDDPDAGPVGYLVMQGDAVVVDRRAWGAKKKR